jgi:hypothetical protein
LTFAAAMPFTRTRKATAFRADSKSSPPNNPSLLHRFDQPMSKYTMKRPYTR